MPMVDQRDVDADEALGARCDWLSLSLGAAGRWLWVRAPDVASLAGLRAVARAVAVRRAAATEL